MIALTETKLKDNICGNIELAGYKFSHVNSPTLAGGVRFYINEKLKYSVLGKLEMKVNSVENMWIKIETNKKLLVLGVVYRHPVRTVEHINLFTSELSNLFHSLNLQKLEFCVAGDFNIDLLQLGKNHHVRMYADSLISCSVKCTISTATRITTSSETLIDHISLITKVRNIYLV